MAPNGAKSCIFGAGEGELNVESDGLGVGLLESQLGLFLQTASGRRPCFLSFFPDFPSKPPRKVEFVRVTN